MDADDYHVALVVGRIAAMTTPPNGQFIRPDASPHMAEFMHSTRRSVHGWAVEVRKAGADPVVIRSEVAGLLYPDEGEPHPFAATLMDDIDDGLYGRPFREKTNP